MLLRGVLLELDDRDDRVHAAPFPIQTEWSARRRSDPDLVTRPVKEARCNIEGREILVPLHRVDALSIFTLKGNMRSSPMSWVWHIRVPVLRSGTVVPRWLLPRPHSRQLEVF